MHKVDFHTHSQASPDGALTAKQYRHMLEAGKLDCIAVTDHNRVDFALRLHAELGDKIIVGEEITTTAGEIIGLFLKEAVPAGLSAADAAAKVHEQGGLVYIPHPFETVRKGLSPENLETIAGSVDIIEVFNGRTLQDRGADAAEWATGHQVPGVASSDAHGRSGWGNTYTMLTELPTRATLVRLLNGATLNQQGVGMRGRLYPKLNRLRKAGRRG